MCARVCARVHARGVRLCVRGEGPAESDRAGRSEQDFLRRCSWEGDAQHVRGLAQPPPQEPVPAENIVLTSPQMGVGLAKSGRSREQDGVGHSRDGEVSQPMGALQESLEAIQGLSVFPFAWGAGASVSPLQCPGGACRAPGVNAGCGGRRNWETRWLPPVGRRVGTVDTVGRWAFLLVRL